jgi:hypothetical protein
VSAESFAEDETLEREALTLWSTLSATQQEIRRPHALGKRDQRAVASTRQLANDATAAAAAAEAIDRPQPRVFCRG